MSVEPRESETEDLNLFWNLQLEPDNTSPLEDPGVGFLIHITHACFGVEVKKNSRTVIICQNEENEKIPICVLKEGSHENNSLDLLFSSAATFKLEGDQVSPVTLTGYIQPSMEGQESFMDADDLDDLDIDDMENIENMEDEDDDEQELNVKSKGNLSAKKRKIRQLESGELPDDNEKQGNEAKKQKFQPTGDKKQPSPPKQPAKKNKPQKQDEQDTKKKDFQKMKNGVETKDIKRGTGSVVQNNSTVLVRYVGQTNDGEVFEKQLDGQYSVSLGSGPFKTWDFALKGMKVGGKRKVMVPSNLAKTAAGTPVNANATYTVEIVDVVNTKG